MLNRPAPRERLLATATFAGIALATVGALDFLVTGGFDFGAHRSASTYAGSLLSSSITTPQLPASPTTVTALAWTEQALLEDLLLAEEAPTTEEELIGARAADKEEVAAPSEDQLYRAIAQLYLEQDVRADARDAEVRGDDAPPADEETPYDQRDLNPDPNAPDSE